MRNSWTLKSIERNPIENISLPLEGRVGSVSPLAVRTTLTPPRPLPYMGGERLRNPWIFNRIVRKIPFWVCSINCIYHPLNSPPLHGRGVATESLDFQPHSTKDSFWGMFYKLHISSAELPSLQGEGRGWGLYLHWQLEQH